MISKKSVRKWEAIAVILATLLTILGGSYSLAVSQAASINNALGVKGASINRSSDEAYIYFPSDYADPQAMEKAYLAVCEEVESEGIVLLRNENGALPLSADEKISCFLTGSVNFNYSASGSSAADTSRFPECPARDAGRFILSSVIPGTSFTQVSLILQNNISVF